MTKPEQMTFKTMGGETVPLRGKHYVQPRGYAAPPGTGPGGETCKTCEYLYRNQLAKTYLKCGLMHGAWTGGRKTDVLAGSPACEKWEKSYE